MQVVHLIKAKQIGGAERHLLMLLPALIARGIDARLLVLVEPDTPMQDLFAEAEARGIPAEAIPLKGNLDVVIINRIRAKLVELKPDILHTHLIHADTFGIAAAKLASVPFLITSRHAEDDFRKRSPIRAANNIMWRGFDAGIAISNAVKNFLIEVEGAPPDRVHTILYGMEHEPIDSEYTQSARQKLRDALELDPDSTVLGMVCRLVEVKGITYALQAMERLTSMYDNLHLAIVGDGPLMHDLKHEVAERGITDCVHFMGWREDVPEIMAGLDLLLITSFSEGFGLVAIEAMSKRVPVIANNVSALPEVIVHQETGILIPPKNVDALVDAISNLVYDRSLRVHMGMLGEDRVEQHFTVDRMADETVALYRRFVPEKPPTTGNVKRKVSIE